MKLILNSKDSVLVEKDLARYLIPIPKNVIPSGASQCYLSVSLISLSIFGLDATTLASGGDFGTLLLLSHTLCPEDTVVGPKLLPVLTQIHYLRDRETTRILLSIDGAPGAAPRAVQETAHPGHKRGGGGRNDCKFSLDNCETFVDLTLTDIRGHHLPASCFDDVERALCCTVVLNYH